MSYLSALKATRHALLDAQRHLLTVDCIRPTPALPADVAVLCDGALWISASDFMDAITDTTHFPEAATCSTLYGVDLVP